MASNHDLRSFFASLNKNQSSLSPCYLRAKMTNHSCMTVAMVLLMVAITIKTTNGYAVYNHVNDNGVGDQGLDRLLAKSYHYYPLVISSDVMKQSSDDTNNDSNYVEYVEKRSRPSSRPEIAPIRFGRKK